MNRLLILTLSQTMEEKEFRRLILATIRDYLSVFPGWCFNSEHIQDVLEYCPAPNKGVQNNDYKSD